MKHPHREYNMVSEGLGSHADKPEKLLTAE